LDALGGFRTARLRRGLWFPHGSILRRVPITLYAVLPIPCTIACKWFFAGIAQCILLGIVTFFVYKPAQAAAPLS
jgi:hypothetical protein